jgi:membrane protein YqaA with SNARE-associated domain
MAFEWGLLGLFLVCFLASTIIPFPSEASLLFFLNSENYSPTSILLVASLGNCLGGCTNYLLGYYGRKILSKKQLLKSESLVQRYGFWIAFFIGCIGCLSGIFLENNGLNELGESCPLSCGFLDLFHIYLNANSRAKRSVST